MLDDNTKSIWQSRSVWGGIIAVVAGIGALFGYSLRPEDAQQLVDAGIAFASLVGGILAIIGRVQATKKIGK